jgi:hypothetical protein
MSAECHKHGCDIVYPEGTWPVGVCQVCELEAKLLAALDERDALRVGLEAIAARDWTEPPDLMPDEMARATLDTASEPQGSRPQDSASGGKP